MLEDAMFHPDTLILAMELGVSRREAIGIMDLLWTWAGHHAIDGDIGRFPPGVIASAVESPPADGERIIAALQKANKLSDGMLTLWYEDRPRHIALKHRRLETRRAQALLAIPKGARRGRPPEAELPPNSSSAAPPVPPKPKKASLRSAAHLAAMKALPLPPGLPAEAWARWVDHRAAGPSPMTSSIAEANLAQLRGWGPKIGERAIEHSIAGGYRGLFVAREDERQVATAARTASTPAPVARAAAVADMAKSQVTLDEVVRNRAALAERLAWLEAQPPERLSLLRAKAEAAAAPATLRAYQRMPTPAGRLLNAMFVLSGDQPGDQPCLTPTPPAGPTAPPSPLPVAAADTHGRSSETASAMRAAASPPCGAAKSADSSDARF